jgi:hypothetical protein
MRHMPDQPPPGLLADERLRPGFSRISSRVA